MTDYTTNYNIPIPDFTADPWADDYESAFTIVDAVLYAVTGISGLLGVWAVSTAYTVGDRVVDETDATVWQCLVNHTSASSGTFAADRTANPTYWVAFGYDLQDPGRGFTFSTTTIDSDPGSGVIRFNHATLASVTQLFVDNLDALETDVSAWLDSFDDIANAGARGVIRVEVTNQPTNWVTFNVTGAVTDGTGYRKVVVTHVASSGSFANAASVRVMFVPAGADGATPLGDMDSSVYDPGAVAADVFDTDNHNDGLTNAVYTLVERSKLAAIEAAADVTDATNVAAALGNGLEALTTAEVDQLENIGATTISAAQWGYLGGAGAYASTLLAPADEATFKAAVNLEIGTDVQAYNAGLAYLAGLAFTNEATFKAGVNLEIGTDVQAQSANLSLWAAETPKDFNRTIVSIIVFNDATDVATGDGAGDVFWRVPALLNGWELVGVAGCHQTAGTGAGTDTTDIQVTRIRAGTPVDMLSTKLTIDEDEVDSKDAATAAVINTSNDDVATGDRIRIDVDLLVTGTVPKGLLVELEFKEP